MKKWDVFQPVQKFKLFLMRGLGSNLDGWLPVESWESAEEAHRGAFEIWMEMVRESEDPEMNEERGMIL